MADIPTRADLFNVGADELFLRSEARAPGTRVSPEEVFTEGSDVNMLIAGASAMGDEVIRSNVLRVRALMLDGAEGQCLDRLTADRSNGEVVRLQATPAVGTIAITRTDGTLGRTYAVGERLRAIGGVEFEITTAVTLAPAALGPVSAQVRARDTGTGGNVDPGTVNAFAVGQPDGSVCINAEPMAGGDSQETDARLRSRMRRFYIGARRGTGPAIEFGALTVAGVRLATAIEEVDSFGRPNGVITLFISDAQGRANSALAAAVRLALLDYRAYGIFVDVVASTPRFEAILYRLRFDTGVDSTIAFDAVRSRTLAVVNGLAPQATLEVSLLFEAARAVPGVIVLQDAIVAPVGDVVPARGQVIRTTLDLITAE